MKRFVCWVLCAMAGVASAAGPYRESFEAGDALPQGWVAQGSAAIVKEGAFDGANALRIQRDEAQVTENVSVTGAPFAASAGMWSLSGATRSALYSPDNSFNATVAIEMLGADGAVIERRALVEQTGAANWRPFHRALEFPQGVEKARFMFTFNKTHGTFDVDALAAKPVESKGAPKIVERIVITGSVMGHLFLPDAAVEFEIDAQSNQPLPANARKAVVVVRDYWGAEIHGPVTLNLAPNGMEKERHRFTGKLVLPAEKFEVGKYYELHASVNVPKFAEAFEHSGFARLPKPESHNYPAMDIPFSIRNWDSRIPEYFVLSNRIGIRLIGTWGDSGWEKIRDQGDMWYGGPSGVGDVEHNGWKNITEEQLRQRAIDWMTKHKDTESLGCVMLGNEPSTRPELVAEKIRAYKIAYEALKSVKPDVFVVTTSVGANEDFFNAGFHNYTDAYDFHIYETYEGVRSAIRKYREMGKRFNAEKPIWCTELGLNSQGQTRHAVAQEVVKKFTAFFAEGGDNVSWFTIMYPDGEGRSRGSGGNAHNIFDAQYNRYNPRLDAIMNYVMINNITVKKFVDEVRHEDGTQAYLFRDAAGDCFQILWREGPPVQHGYKLSNHPVTLIRIDGSSIELAPDSGGHFTLGVSSEPVMLRYSVQKASAQFANQLLPREFAAPAFAIPASQDLSIVKGQTREIKVAGANLKVGEFSAELPPRWSATFKQFDIDVICTITAPADTDARAGRVMIHRRINNRLCSEVSLAMPIMSPVSIAATLAGRDADGQPGIRVFMANNGAGPAAINWNVELLDAWAMTNCGFRLNAPGSLDAFLKGETEGNATLNPNATRELDIRVANFTPQTLYRFRATVTDDAGRRSVIERYAGGFALAKRASQPVAFDGTVESFWRECQPEVINTAAAAFRFSANQRPWQGPEDLSATWRAAWDDTHLYLLVEVADDVFRAPFANGSIWNQDGLQFLFDPTRTQAEKAGKHDIAVGLGNNVGPQAFIYLSAHTSVPTGEATKDFKLSITDFPEGGAGGKRYKIGIPWTHLAPFKPAPGANLGMGMILNEDDGAGRIGFSGWFSGPHTKNLDDVGDIILE